MPRNVLTASLVACALTASWPGSLVGTATVWGATLRRVEWHDPEQTRGESDWLWDGMRGLMTLPPGPTWIDTGRIGSGRACAGDVY